MVQNKNKKSKKENKQGAAPQTPIEVPEEFSKIIFDMCNDLTGTFPEYAQKWEKYTKAYQETLDEETQKQNMKQLYNYCLGVFPERFFDILYKNQDIFKPDSQINTKFLPDVDFRTLFLCDGVSENTQNVMWNYLQLLLFTIIGGIQDKSRFGDTKNIFDGINENDLFEKLSETMESMTSFFQEMESAADFMGGSQDQTESNTAEDATKESGEDEEDQDEADPEKETGFKFPKFPKIPDIKELHAHLKSLFDGKIGSLAKELAEEITGDLSSLLGEDMKDVKTTKDVLQFLMKDPKKITGIIQKISEKLKHKMSSGEISQEELMKEATDLLSKMKDMGGGMDQFKDMFKNMGIPMPKNAKIDMNALNRMTSHQSMRERLKKRMMEKKQAQQEAIMKMAASMQAQKESPIDDIVQLSQQLGLNLDSNDGIVGSNGSAQSSKKKKGKK